MKTMNNNTERETAIVDMAVKYLVRNTRFSAYQVFDVLRLVDKYGEKAKYYMTKKQNIILKLLMIAINWIKEPEEDED